MCCTCAGVCSHIGPCSFCSLHGGSGWTPYPPTQPLPYVPYVPYTPSQPLPYVPMTTDRTVITLTTEAFLLQQILEEMRKIRDRLDNIHNINDSILSKLEDDFK